MEQRSSATEADNFKLITGIGPKTERRLHESGVLTYARLATMSPTELAELLHDFAGMSASRIEEQGWASQAHDLMLEGASGQQSAEEAPGNGQHYATFRIELLLNEKNEVRRTGVSHIQGQEDHSWVGWDGNRLLDFIVKHASLRSPNRTATREERPVQARRTLEPLPKGFHSSLDISQRHALRKQPVDLGRMGLGRGGARSPDDRRPSPPSETAAPRAIVQMQVIPAGQRQPSRAVRHDQPFSARLTLDRRQRVRTDEPLNYTASLFASSPDQPQAQPVGESSGILAPGDTDIDVSGHIVSPGTYRLEAHLTFGGATRVSTALRGLFVHVY